MELIRENNYITYGDWTFPIGSLSFEKFMRGNTPMTRIHFGLKEIGEVEGHFDTSIYYESTTDTTIVPKVDTNNVQWISVQMVLENGYRLHYTSQDSTLMSRLIRYSPSKNNSKVWYIRDNELKVFENNILQAVFNQNLNLLNEKN